RRGTRHPAQLSLDQQSSAWLRRASQYRPEFVSFFFAQVETERKAIGTQQAKRAEDPGRRRSAQSGQQVVLFQPHGAVADPPWRKDQVRLHDEFGQQQAIAFLGLLRGGIWGLLVFLRV